MSIDRRRYTRWTCVIPCQVHSGDSRLNCSIQDLSFNGACITNSPRAFEVGSRIKVVLSPGSGPIQLEGRVAYCMLHYQDHRLGVEFLGSWEDRLADLMPFFQERIEVDDIPI